jgi:hypothetical protein
MKNLIIIFLISIIYPSISYAEDLYENDNWTISVDGNLKGYGMGMHTNLPYLYVVAPSSLGGMEWSSRSGLMGIGEARLKFEGAYKEDRFKFKIHFKSSTSLANQPNIFGGMGFSGMSEPVRLFPLQYTQSDDPKSTWKNEIDRLMFKLRLWKFDFIIGRQPIGLGVGFIWQPADLLGTFSPLEIDKEYKAGVDAIRINLATSKFSELSLFAVFAGPPCSHRPFPSLTDPLAWVTPDSKPCTPGEVRFDTNYSSFAIRFRTTIKKWDVGVLGGMIRGDAVGGLFTSGTAGRWKIRSEVTYTHNLLDELIDEPLYSYKKDFVRGILGFNYSFKTKQPFSIIGEFYYNGFGSTDSDDYEKILKSGRVRLFNEVTNLGMFLGGMGINWEPTEKVKFAFMTMMNLTDPGVHLSMSINFRLDDNSSVVIGGFLPFGKTAKLNGAVIDYGSEFGLYPKMVYFQYKRYF